MVGGHSLPWSGLVLRTSWGACGRAHMWALPRARSAAAGGRGSVGGLGPLAASWLHQEGGKEQSQTPAGRQAQIQGQSPGDLARVLLQQEVAAGLPSGGLHSNSPPCSGLPAQA